MSEQKQTPGRKIYLHPALRRHKAPSGCIVVSDKPEDDDSGASLIAVDPNGIALTDDEAESMAAEICRRWNVMPDLLEALEAAKAWMEDVTDPCGEPYNAICAALAKARPSQVEA